MIVRDGDWLLHDHDVQMGRTIWRRDNGDGTETWRTDYAVDDTVDINTAQRNIAQAGWKGDYHHVASIPMGVYWDQVHEAVRQHDERYLSKWLNSSDNRAWRTKDGNI
jgi:hypothetical protein